jgi:hypothetical protein
MTTTRTYLIFAIVLISSSFHFGQTAGVPDLSGHWELNLQKSKLPKTVKVGQETLVIKQDGPNIEFDYDADGKQNTETYTADKKDKVLKEIPAAGSQILAKAYWKDTMLVIETRVEFKSSSPLGGAEMMNTKDSWLLSGNGLTLTEKYTTDNGQSLKIYDRQK